MARLAFGNRHAMKRATYARDECDELRRAASGVAVAEILQQRFQGGLAAHKRSSKFARQVNGIANPKRLEELYELGWKIDQPKDLRGSETIP